MSTENLITPLLSIICFATGTFVKHNTKSFLTKVFGIVRQKFFVGTSLYLPLSSIEFFAAGNFLKQCTEGFPYGRVRHCETKVFGRKTLIPHFLSIEFFATGIFLKHSSKVFPYGIFWLFKPKKLSTKNLDNSPPHPQSFSLPEFFSNTAQKCSPTKFFGTVRQKFSDGNS